MMNGMQANRQSSTTYAGLDLFKFLMAISVVAIHTHPLATNQGGFFFNFYKCFLELAVPFFFLTSGYLLAYKLNNNYLYNELIIFGVFKKISKLYLIWTLIYLPLTIYGLTVGGELGIKGFLLTLRNVLFKGENYFSWPLWYLLSLIYFSLLLLIFNRFRWRYDILVIVTMLIYVLNFIDINALLGFSHVAILKNVFGTTRIFSGFVFMALGIFIYHRKLKCSFCWAVFSFVAGLYICSLGIPLISDLMLVGTSVAIFFIGCNIMFDRKEISSFFRKVSTVMFFTHMYFYFLYISFAPENLSKQTEGFLFSLLSTLVLGSIVVKYGNKVKILKTIF